MVSKNDFENLSDILKNIFPHSEKIKKYLLSKNNFNNGNEKTSKNIEKIIELIEDSSKDSMNRNLVVNDEDSKFKQLSNYLEKNQELDLDIEAILRKLDDIKDEINIMKEEDRETENLAIREKEEKERIENNLKNKEIQEEKEKFEEKTRENKKNEEREIEESNLKIKEDLLKKENEQKNTKQKEEIEKKNEDNKKEKLNKKSEEEKEIKDKKDKIPQQEEKKEKNSLEKEEKEKENKEKIIKKYLNNNNIKVSENTEVKFVEAIAKERENIANAKKLLENNGVNNIEGAKSKINELEGRAKQIESLISAIISMGYSVPPDLESELNSIKGLVSGLEGSIDILSKGDLSK